jgi:hypothetical protein
MQFLSVFKFSLNNFLPIHVIPSSSNHHFFQAAAAATSRPVNEHTADGHLLGVEGLLGEREAAAKWPASFPSNSATRFAGTGSFGPEFVASLIFRIFAAF